MSDSRITSSSTGQYDTLLAISQDSMNAAISTMWDVEGDNLEDVTINKGAFGNMSGKVDEVVVQVLADGTGRGTVLVRMSFASGTANFLNPDTADFYDPADMTGWKICFSTDIGLNDVHNAIDTDTKSIASGTLTAKALADAKSRLADNEETVKKFGEQAGDYSIQRLFIDFTTAKLSSYVEEQSQLDNIDASQKLSFGILLKQWLIGAKKEGQSVLGYGLSVNKSDVKKDMKVADCLIPTSLVFNTYGYRATPADKVPTGWDGEANRNCLVYCNMTEGRAIQGERLLQWSGNFTSAQVADKETRIDGSMVLRRGLFLDRFIIPMLKQYNDDMQIVPAKFDFTRDGDAGQRRYHWSYTADLGYNPQHPDWNDAYFNFSENATNARFDAIKNSPEYGWAQQQGYNGIESTTGVSWSWEKREGINKPDWNDDWHFPQQIVNWTDHLGGSQNSYIHVDVVPVPGDNRIKIRGLSTDEIKLMGYHTRLTDHNLDYQGSYKISCYWQTDLAVYQENGVLVCKSENTKTFVNSSSSDSKDLPGDSQGGAFMADLQAKLPAMMQSKDSIVKAINDSLNATGRFTHPAAGSFNMYNPVWNVRGDLLASVRYNAPKKEDQLFKLPQRGPAIKQPDSDPSKKVVVSGETTAPIPTKGK